jgi:hypothetical protein
MMRRRATPFVLGLCLWLAGITNPLRAEVAADFWDRLALRDDAPLVLSVKYADRAARSRVLEKSLGGADLPFINRIIVRIARNAALSLQGDSSLTDVEILGPRSADRTFHKLLELYRVYLYQVSGRFEISVVNFSQGVPYWDRNSDERGDRTIAEALDVIGVRVAPVLVAVGDGPEFGIGEWAMARAALPVVATSSGGAQILANSARPPPGQVPWNTVLYADGAPTAGKNLNSSTKACGEGAHLTADQMLHPESAFVPEPGGSSFATFKATWNVCFIHQYTEILRVQLRARTPVGSVEVEPFVAYYVDSPVDKACPATQYRWADQRFQADAPKYEIRAADKARLDEFVNGNSLELRANYSIPILRAFLNHLPPHPMTSARASERYVSSDAVLAMLRSFRLRDLVEVAANPRNIKFENWKKIADRDPAPVIRSELVDAIDSYCRNQTLFLVLSDEATPIFDTMP